MNHLRLLFSPLLASWAFFSSKSIIDSIFESIICCVNVVKLFRVFTLFSKRSICDHKLSILRWFFRGESSMEKKTLKHYIRTIITCSITFNSETQLPDILILWFFHRNKCFLRKRVVFHQKKVQIAELPICLLITWWLPDKNGLM